MDDWNRKTRIILIGGKAGVGKTTFAKFVFKYLPKHYQATSIISPFARGVKDTAMHMGWDGNKTDRGRKLLQEIGNAGRNYDQNIWIKYMLDRLDRILEVPPDVILVDDWRFPNEYRFFEGSNEYTAVRVRVESPERELLKGTLYYDDISEISLPSLLDKNIMGLNYYDAAVYNTGTLEDLEETARGFVEEYLLNLMEV